jgi:hypothetical protein
MKPSRAASFAITLSVSGCGALGPPPGITVQSETVFADCADVSRRSPGAPDGIYRLKAGDRSENAYCDLRTGTVLCAETEGEHRGQTRDQSQIPFLLTSVLEPSGLCRIWAVRHASEGQPLDRLSALAGASDALVQSTCEALGFRGGDEEMHARCPYTSDQDCGFSGQILAGAYGPHVSKWGNSCDCNVHELRPFYSLEKPVFFSRLPWTFDGTLSARCQTR